jgi:hypothetical protein
MAMLSPWFVIVQKIFSSLLNRRNSSSNQLSAIALFFAGGITAEYLVDVGRARRSR